MADRCNISRSTVFKVIRRVILLPNKDFPGIIGVVDGTHIKIDEPHEDPDSYLNRKQFYSIQVINLIFELLFLY